MIEIKITDLAELEEYVKVNTQQYDESHDFNHALKVFDNCKKIINMDNLAYIIDWDVIAYTAYLHDVCDHKYDSTVTKKDLFDFTREHIGYDKADWVLKIINNISYSSEVKGKIEKLPEPYETYRNIVSDADKLEAIGEIGLERCKQYSFSRNLTMNNVIDHCHEKLMRLLPNGFIRTNAGKQLALPLHNYIVDFCKNYIK